jgi:hypothetical protein
MGKNKGMTSSKLREIFKITKKIDKIVVNSGFLHISSRDFKLKSLEDSAEYSLTVRPKQSPRISKIISFEDIPLRRLLIISSPGFSDESQAISKIENVDSTVFNINLKKINTNAQEYNIKFEIGCEIEPIVRKLVQKNTQTESVDDEKATYWLHAQLKELKDLTKSMRKLDLTDIPFVVNVAVHQDVKTKFPKRRQKELEVIAKWARELDRNRKLALDVEHLSLKLRKRKEKNITDLLRDLQVLFDPHKFKSFIDVMNEFYYSECFRGTEFYDQIPFRTFPKWMAVISRTDLSVDKPASEGELVYKKADFSDAVLKAITKK